MAALYDNKPIIICSTGGYQTTAIHLLRLSGFDSLKFVNEFFSVSHDKIKPRFAHLGGLYQNKNSQKIKLDDILLTFFPAPHSYTGENCLELSVHGNPLNVKRILDLFIEDFGFRLAEPGEFTYRALKNQKLTISQVEGLDLLLNAHNPLMLDQGLSLLNGQLDRLYQKLYHDFIELKSSVEMAIDFSEDIGVEECDRRLNENLKSFDSVLEELYLKTQNSQSHLLSPYIALFGPTNAGKSTFFNYLLKDQRSLVSSIEGTTRDYISETISLSSGHYKLIDTAGLRETTDTIESAGIQKAIDLLQTSFYKIFVIAYHQIGDFDFSKMPTRPDLIVISHVDQKVSQGLEILPLDIPICFANLLEGIFFGPIEPLKNTGPIEPPINAGPIEPPKNSGPIEPLKNAGPIEPLKNAGPVEPPKNAGPIEPPKNIGPIGPIDREVFKLINSKYLESSKTSPLLLERHINIISAIYTKRQSGSHLNDSDFNDLGIIDNEIRYLESDVANLIGVVTPDQLLNHIFSNFCIGK